MSAVRRKFLEIIVYKMQTFFWWVRYVILKLGDVKTIKLAIMINKCKPPYGKWFTDFDHIKKNWKSWVVKKKKIERTDRESHGCWIICESYPLACVWGGE